MAERGLAIDHSTIYRWVQAYAPEFERRSRPYLKACNDSWRVDETYIKVKKIWVYLSRAVDSAGNTIEFLLSPTRDAEAAKRFFLKVLRPSTDAVSSVSVINEPVSQLRRTETLQINKPALRVINVDKNAAYPKAIADLKAAGMLPDHVELRQVKYLNNILEQDHRFIKRLTKPGMGFFSFETARRTLQGYEMMNMLCKGQIQDIIKGDIGGQVTFIASLFGIAA